MQLNLLVGRPVAMNQAFFHYIHQMESCQVACPAAAMNLRWQEHLSGRHLQTGILPQALLMTQTIGQGPWSLLQLDLVLASWQPATTLCSGVAHVY